MDLFEIDPVRAVISLLQQEQESLVFRAQDIVDQEYHTADKLYSTAQNIEDVVNHLKEEFNVTD
jgi:hypothetical protein